MYRRLTTAAFRYAGATECRSALSKTTEPLASMGTLSARTPSCVFVSLQQQRLYSMVYRMGVTEFPKHMTRKQVEDKVIEAVKKWDRFPADRSEKLHLDARFVEDLGFDSLDQVEIIMSVEDVFDCEIPDEVNEKFKTPRDVANYFCKKEDIE